TIQDGERVSSATAFVQPALNRFNLDVLITTHVTKILRTGTSSGVPAFRAVQMAQSTQGLSFRVNGSREVILSAGAIATPQLLMLSGIGDPIQLARFGIQTIVNLTDVGRNLQDHTNVPMAFVVNATDTLDTFLRDPGRQEAALYQWRSKRMGQYTTSPGTHIGWFRLPDEADIFKTVADPSAGSHAPHYELLDADSFNSAVLPRPANGNFISITCVLVSPTSRGSVTLSSSDPFTIPTIDPAFLQSPFDIFTLREAIKSARQFLSAPVWHGYIVAPFGPAANATTDSEIEAYARANAGASWHSVGTARMSARGSQDGVVDPDLRVKGTAGLRVVDASVLPVIPGAHTQVPTYVIAERASRLIQASNP
ncbi:GMC oxidoreductase-domain-containing protein, partial [Amylostereum chailletii]